MILGISGSPRKNGITAKAVNTILDNCSDTTKYISLTGKRINGCISCMGCIHTNKCVVKDDFTEIIEDILKADIIIFGAPNYYNQMNAISHALWERCFCFRHNNQFKLKDKKIAFFTTGYKTNTENNPVLTSMQIFANYNKMEIIDQFAIDAYSQCYSCELGKTCVSGNVVKQYGIVDNITENMLPLTFGENPVSIEKSNNTSTIINKHIERLNNEK